MTEIRNVMIVGAGTMGAPIGQVMAARGFEVCLVDQSKEHLDRAAERIADNARFMIAERLCTAEENALAESKLRYVVQDDAQFVAGEADLVLESVFERPDIKRAVFEKLDKFCRPDCIFCSNTSASNVFEFVKVSHGERFLITHWFNPAYLMQLVEVVRGPETSQEVVDVVTEFLRGIGKKPCVLAQYVPGFIVNRFAAAVCREAGYMVSQGWTTGPEIDDAIKAINGVRYAFEGPMALNDALGWDLILTGCKDIFASLCNADVSDFAERLVREGKLGVKTGQGVYDYGDVSAQEFHERRAEKILKMYRFIQAL
jgi:3-hydroxybutyryl-CoA dehydrogenase